MHSISFAANCLTDGPVQSYAQSTGQLFSEVSSIGYLGVIIRPRWPSHMSLNTSSNFKYLGSVLLVSVGSRHFLSPIVVGAAIVILQDSVVLMDLMKIVGCRLVSHDVDRTGKEVQHEIRIMPIVFIVSELKKMLASSGDSLMFCYSW